ncbi:MAG TPA: DUF6542 domain-containing protein [Streptosporangiaceae bacterium]
MPGRYGVAIVAGCAGLGALLTAVTGGQPGTLLGVFLIVGTLAAASAVRTDAAHLIIPVPPLAYLVAATLAGIVTIPGGVLSTTGLAVNALQWIAHGFLVMVIATAAAAAITVLRRRAQSRPAALRPR